MKMSDKFFSRKSFLVVPLGFIASLIAGGAADAATKSKAKKKVVKKVVAKSNMTPTPTPSPSSSVTQTPTPAATSATTPSPEPSTAQSPTATPTPPPAGVNVGASALVAKGESKLFTVGGNKVFVTRTADGLSALSNICTHQGCEVSRSGTNFACPCHGAQFSVDNGDVKAGPAGSPLRSFKVAEFQGDIYVAI
jgi:nitrite reductase/ring-hydroxylating ferredoxin subunit